MVGNSLSMLKVAQGWRRSKVAIQALLRFGGVLLAGRAHTELQFCCTR